MNGALDTGVAPASTMHLECKTCGASLSLEASHRSATCPFCASATVVERGPAGDRPVPTFALGFTVTRERAIEIMRRWAREGLFRHSGLDGGAIEKVQGIYVPAWLFSAVADVDYSASIGENYQVTKTRTVTRDGKSVTETYTETETEWRSLSGRFLGYVSDVLVTASAGLTNAELESLEPYDLRTLCRYTPAMLAGWLAEDVSLSGEASRQHAQAESTTRLTARLGRFMPGDSHRNLSFTPRLRDEAADVVLVPVWIVALRHSPDAPPLRVLVNGQTGKLLGHKPLSWWKVTLAVLFWAGVLGAVVAWVLWFGSTR